jgi:SAM-dependent methyltransferase
VIGLMNEELENFAYLLPFSPFRGTVWHFLDKKSHSILDVGCGKGSVMRTINLHGKNFLRIGVDINSFFIKNCKQKRIYDALILADICDLPLKRKIVDTVVCVQVIEHLTKSDGIKLIQNLETLARRQVIFSVPIDLPPLGGDVNKPLGGPHKCSWTPDEFKRLGYKVRGECPSFLGGYELSFILPLIGLVYFNPNIAGSMVCVKNLVTEQH